MIRFKTIEPGAAEKPAAKPAPAAPAVVAPDQPDTPEQPEDGEAAPKAKGLTRKTPMRAKKPDAARLFRD